MDVREKLVELLNEVQETGVNEIPAGFGCTREYVKNEKVASHLIAHGVTVQEWISVEDRLPEHGDVVLCFMKFGEQRILQWDNVSNWWLGYGHGDDWQKADVTHWCCLPQPPKGE